LHTNAQTKRRGLCRRAATFFRILCLKKEEGRRRQRGALPSRKPVSPRSEKRSTSSINRFSRTIRGRGGGGKGEGARLHMRKEKKRTRSISYRSLTESVGKGGSDVLPQDDTKRKKRAACHILCASMIKKRAARSTREEKKKKRRVERGIVVTLGGEKKKNGLFAETLVERTKNPKPNSVRVADLREPAEKGGEGEILARTRHPRGSARKKCKDRVEDVVRYLVARGGKGPESRGPLRSHPPTSRGGRDARFTSYSRGEGEKLEGNSLWKGR